MFSGVVEACVKVREIKEREENVELALERPPFFDDLKAGDSVAVDGVCLTVEEFDDEIMTFALAAESLKILQWRERFKSSPPSHNWCFNVERSLCLGDRIHGHLVTGHVEGVGKITRVEDLGESRIIEFEVPESVLPFIWKKGSITVNGVSLTINKLDDISVEICLIPESMKRTNLSMVKEGEGVHIEPDYMARAMVRNLQLNSRN